MDLPEVSGNRAIRGFLLAINIVDPIYGNSREEARNTIENQDIDLEAEKKLRQRTMDEEIFHNRVRLQSTTSAVKDTRSVLATDAGGPESLLSRATTNKGRKQKTRTRARVRARTRYLSASAERRCGTWIAPTSCLSKAFAGWQENPSDRKKVDDAFKDTKVQTQVKKSLECRAKIA
ncbi:hypothetical protein MMC22_008648 [Lobaria immixta]|nr:hypothetical protein [Lobaria immixta]